MNAMKINIALSSFLLPEISSTKAACFEFDLRQPCISIIRLIKLI